MKKRGRSNTGRAMPEKQQVTIRLDTATVDYFKALADENINMQMISTSEIKISVVVDEKYAELAVRTLHQAFELEAA